MAISSLRRSFIFLYFVFFFFFSFCISPLSPKASAKGPKASSKGCWKAADLVNNYSTVLNHPEAFCSPFDEHYSRMERPDTEHFCPCCGYQGNFTSVPFAARQFAKCPHCTALEIHRLACMNIARYGLLNPRGRVRRVLHFGPNAVMSSGLESVCAEARVDHIPVDFFAQGYRYASGTLHANVENLLFPSKSISLILSFHVLEHVRRLDEGFLELHRDTCLSKFRAANKRKIIRIVECFIRMKN